MTGAREVFKSVEVFRLPTWGAIANMTFSPAFSRAYKILVAWADIVHFHMPSPLPELVHMVRGVPLETKTVCTFHAAVANTKYSFVSPLYEPVQHCLLGECDRIVVTAPQNKNVDILSEYNNKISVVPLAYDKIDHSVSNNCAIDEFDICEGENIVLSVGRLVYYKGYEYLIRAMPGVDGHLVLVGKGERLNKLRRLADAVGVADRIHFTGFVPDATLSSLYSLADVFVLPSITASEAFGIVQAEAMARGLPVINTDLPTGVPYVSIHNKTGITVPPRDVESLKISINKLLSDHDLYSRYSHNAIKRSKKFSKETMIREYFKIYNEVL
jgi:rhamnosyl/mannosyltransferase